MAATKISGRHSPIAPSLVAPSSVDTRLGELLQGNGTLTEQDIQDIFAAQLERGERFGEAGTRLGLLSEQDVQRALARRTQFPRVSFGQSALSTELVSAYRPHSKRAEALRTLRSELVLRWFGRGKRLLAVVEARAGNGCSVLAANLAVTFAQLGERTLLIDGDLRAPTQQTLFGLTAKRGLVDFIEGRESFNKMANAVPGFNCLSVMCAGAAPLNAQELLGHISFGYLLETSSALYDVVIVDTPPLLECADAQIIASRAGGVLLATQRHRARLADAVRVNAQLEPAGAVLLGAVIDG
jgi:chain length determinant protein tyrosine kinase EpsG